MSNLENYLPFVKEQQGLHEKLARRFEEQPWRRDLHVNTANRLAALAEDLLGSQRALEEAREHAAKPERRSSVPLPLTPEDIEGLPEELVKELSISDADKLEFQIISLINQAGGILSLDRILIGLFKATGEIHKRNIMTSKLYRMVQKDLLFTVPPKKGVYSTEPVPENQNLELPLPAEPHSIPS